MVRQDETLIPKATTPSAASPQPPLLYQEGSNEQQELFFHQQHRLGIERERQLRDIRIIVILQER